MNRWQSPWLWLLLIVALMLLVRGTTAVAHIRHNFSAIPYVAAVHGLDFLADRSAVVSDDTHPLPAVEARSLAYLALLEGDPATAERWLQSADPTDHTAFLTQFELCRLTWQQGRRAEALPACQAGNVSAAYWIRLGLEALQDQNPSLAVDYFGMATAVEPDSPEAWYRYGRVQLELGVYVDTVAAYEKALVFGYPVTPGFYNGLGEAYSAMGQVDAARQTYADGIVAFPDARGLYNNLAVSYLQTGQPELADSWYSRLLQRWPDSAHAWAARGELALANGKPVNAIDFFKRATYHQPENIVYWHGLAQSHLAAGNTADAEAIYAHILTLAPNDLVARQHLGLP